MRIGVIAVPGTFDSALTSVLDVFGAAESLRYSIGPQIPEITTLIAGVGQHVTARRGLIVPIDAAGRAYDRIPQCDDASPVCAALSSGPPARADPNGA